MHNCKDCKIKSAAARNLNQEEFEILESNSVQVRFKKGDIIFKEEALTLNVAYLKTGMVKLHKKGPSREKILRIVRAPSYLGIPTTFGDKINHFSATAILDTSVCFIDANYFKNFILHNGQFAYEIITDLCRNELNDYQRYTSYDQKQIPGRIADTLICFAEKLFDSYTFQLPLNRSEMGDLIGTSRESVSRILTEFNQEKIIELQTSQITILKPDLLREISEKG